MVSGGRRRKEEKEGPFRGDENQWTNYRIASLIPLALGRTINEYDHNICFWREVESFHLTMAAKWQRA
jgi:hypothetical protein